MSSKEQNRIKNKKKNPNNNNKYNLISNIN